jgi:hypothetical protein
MDLFKEQVKKTPALAVAASRAILPPAAAPPQGASQETP